MCCLTHNPLLREMVLKKSVPKAAHQWTWDEQPTQRQLIILLARLQWLCGLAQWAGPIGNPHLWVQARKYWGLSQWPYGLAIQGPYIKWSSKRREERKRGKATEQRPHDLWEKYWLHSEFSRPMFRPPWDSALLCLTDTESFQGAEQYRG